jgi:hypothetical protein
MGVTGSQWPRCLGCGSASSRLLGLWVRIPPVAWMSVSCECCVLSGRGLCVGLIARPEKSYRVGCVWVWSRSLDNEEALAHGAVLRHWGKMEWQTEHTRVALLGLTHSVLTVGEPAQFPVSWHKTTLEIVLYKMAAQLGTPPLMCVIFSALWMQFLFEICAFLGYFAAWNGNPLPTFRDVSVPSPRVKKCKRKRKPASRCAICIGKCVGGDW